MNYDIKITNSNNDDGLIEFDRLSFLTQSTKEIAVKALMLKLAGFSEIKPTPAMFKAAAIKLQSLSGNKGEGTHLLLNCDNLSNYIKEFQTDAFNPSLYQDLQQLTPMALVIQTFRAALVDGEDRNNLDKPLLKALLKFKKNFSDSDEIFHLSNRQSIPSVQVKMDDFKKIELIDESIPEPNKVTVNGKLDEMKHSKSRVVLLTAEGAVNAFIKNQQVIGSLAGYFGKELTIRGIAHYRPGGKLSHIEIQEFSEPQIADKYFSRIPNVMTAEQQVLFQVKSRGNNAFANLIGKWPGDENVEEIFKRFGLMRTFVLDTGIVVHYLRQSPLYLKIETDHNLSAADTAPVISAVTKGELLSFAQQRGWGANKMQLLSAFLQNVITVDIKAADNTLQLAYAQLDAYSKNKATDVHGVYLPGAARTMGKNDLWIAATAFVLKAPLLTIDGDFDHLNTTFIDVIKYAP